VVAELLERGDFQPVGLVDDQELGERGAAVPVGAQEFLPDHREAGLEDSRPPDTAIGF
jgi:hypothetical protein